MKTTLIITAYKEVKSVAKLVEGVLDPKFKNIPEGEFEILLVCPDSETHKSALKIIEKYNFQNFIYVKDPGKLKPTALNLAFRKASGEIWVLTDGDVYLGGNSIPRLVSKLLSNSSLGAVSGRPKSVDSKSNFWGYIGHLLTDAAHHKRMKLISKVESFFPVSGYLYAMKRHNIQIPRNTLTDDAYISYKITEKNLSIGYEPNAEVFVKFPTNLKDWLNQKARSHGGFIQLKHFSIVREGESTRTFKDEISYAWFPIKYAKSSKELLWSFLLFPLRLSLWARMIWDRKIIKKGFEETWVRIESTK